MRRHPGYACEMLSPIAFLRPALDIPYCHHEKWDGTGYPRGLKGEQIPLAARIFAVVDVWDALRSDRPYRAAGPKSACSRTSLAGRHAPRPGRGRGLPPGPQPRRPAARPPIDRAPAPGGEGTAPSLPGAGRVRFLLDDFPETGADPDAQGIACHVDALRPGGIAIATACRGGRSSRSAAWRWAGLGLPDLLRAEAAARQRPARRTSRSSWSTCRAAWPTRTRSTSSPTPRRRSAASSSRSRRSVPGVQVGELLPRMAGVHGQAGGDPLARRPARRAFELPEHDRLPDGRQPARGEAALRLGRREGPGPGRPGRAAVRRPVPDDAAQAVQHARPRPPRPGRTAPARMDGDDLALLKQPSGHADRFARPAGSCSTSSTSSAARSTAPSVGGMDSVYRRAFDVLTSSKLVEALDVEREDPQAPRPLRHRLAASTWATAPRCGTTSS